MILLKTRVQPKKKIFYHLRRYCKNCLGKPINKTAQNVQYISALESLLVCACDSTNVLTKVHTKNILINTMRLDKISFTTKN